MIKRSAEKKVRKVSNFKGGDGEFVIQDIIDSPDDLYGKGRVFGHSVLNKDCGVGWHLHEGDCEYFYILKGEGEYSDNGVVTTVYPGDVCFTGDGEGHYLVNRRDEPLELIALVVYK
ncbi:MAG: cupin domain-containing protein [Clostridia bacterium]|nr:cupin domain-containing protein [Clostridia bacterium]